MMSFDILFGAETLRGPRSGIGRHTVEMLAALQRRSDLGSLLLLDGHQIRGAGSAGGTPELEGKAAANRLARVAQLFARTPGVAAAWRGVRRRRLAKELDRIFPKPGRQVIYHEPNFVPAPYDGPCTVAVHDLFWSERPDLLPPERRRWFQRNAARAMRQAWGFACVSAFTAGELRRRFDVGTRPVVIVPNAPSAAFRPMDADPARPVLARYGLDDRRYFLAVATIEPRKNLLRLVAAHAGLSVAERRHCPLILVGQVGWLHETGVLDRTRNDAAVRWLGRLPDEDLVALTARALAATLVSLHEGFGLPVLEAMACGTTVLAAGTTGTAEVAGEAALLVEPSDTDAIRDGLRRLIEDESLRDGLRLKGFARAAAFDWDDSAERLVALWHTCLAR